MDPPHAANDTGPPAGRLQQRGERVTARTAARLAWSLWALAMALEVAAILLWLPNHATLVDRFGTAEDSVPHVFLVPGYTTVGAVIAARTRNRIGWLFLAFGLAAALLTFANPYHMRGVVIAPGSLPAAALAERLGPVLWPSSYLFFGLLLLLFPDGRLPSPRWRPAALTFAISWGLLALYSAVEPITTTVHGVKHTNPLAIQALDHPTWKAGIQGVTTVAVAALAVVALAPLLRFRRAGPVQRQQLKWFAFVVGGSFASVLAAGAFVPVLPIITGALMVVAFAGVLVGLPVAVGLAVLRYRLYDIDRLINRTVVYGLLTVLLAGVYSGAVLTLGQVFGGVGERTPSWAVAGATLAVAALFQPARRRIQQAVDRRFNRRRYDAAETIEGFSARLRDELDLSTLSAELLTVVHQTVQPTTASLWLRPTPRAAAITPAGQLTTHFTDTGASSPTPPRSSRMGPADAGSRIMRS
jgi:hypothetical protein